MDWLLGKRNEHQKKGIGVATAAYGLLCGVDSYEENGILRLVSILSGFLLSGREPCHMMLMARLHQ